MDYITSKNQLKTRPNTLQNHPKNTPEYPPNPPETTLLSRFLSGDGIMLFYVDLCCLFLLVFHVLFFTYYV